MDVDQQLGAIVLHFLTDREEIFHQPLGLVLRVRAQVEHLGYLVIVLSCVHWHCRERLDSVQFFIVLSVYFKALLFFISKLPVLLVLLLCESFVWFESSDAVGFARYLDKEFVAEPVVHRLFD